jgi:hypothetical protein
MQSGCRSLWYKNALDELRPGFGQSYLKKGVENVEENDGDMLHNDAGVGCRTGTTESR